MAGRSRLKGKVGEREIAAFLREHGVDGARRGQQFAGGPDSPDVVGLPGVHIESKRTEALRLWEAVDQAKREARSGSIPTVWHRSSRRPWIVILSATDFLLLLRLRGEPPTS
jgi:Holliday junction resolvase